METRVDPTLIFSLNFINLWKKPADSHSLETRKTQSRCITEVTVECFGGGALRKVFLEEETAKPADKMEGQQMG